MGGHVVNCNFNAISEIVTFSCFFLSLSKKKIMVMVAVSYSFFEIGHISYAPFTQNVKVGAGFDQ